MLYLVLAIFSSAMVSIAMRFSEAKIQSSMGLLASNYLVCSVTAFIYCRTFAFTAPLMGFSAVNGLLYLAGFILMQFNIQKNGVVLSSTFMKLGVLVPVLASMIFFKEMPTALQMLGLCLAVSSIVLLKKRQSSQNLMMGPLLLMMICGGMTDFTSKIFETLFETGYKDMFLLMTFLSALFFCLGLVVVRKELISRNELVYGLLVGIPNYFSARFLLLALGSVDAVVAYPTYSVATILVVTMLGKILFHEHLSKRQLTVMALILVSLILLNIA